MNGDLLALGNAVSQAFAKVFATPAVRRSSPVSALLVAAPVALLVALAVALVLRSPVSTASLSWGALAGLVGGVGLVLNFRAFVYGPVAVVVPVMTCTTTTILVGISWLTEVRPARGTLVGAVVCVLAVVVISWGHKEERQREHTPQTVGFAIGAGICFAGFGILIKHGFQDSSLWAVVGTRTGVLAVVLILALIQRARFPAERPAKGSAVLSGAFDAAANIFFAEATTVTTLAVVSVIASLTPIFAAVLAFAILGQRLAVHQTIGLVLAVSGVFLVIMR